MERMAMKVLVVDDEPLMQDLLEETLKRAVRRLVSDEIGKKPEVTVIISRLE